MPHIHFLTKIETKGSVQKVQDKMGKEAKGNKIERTVKMAKTP